MNELSIVKIGGNLLDEEKSLATFLSDYAQLAGSKILIHGGGKQATELAQALGLETQMVQGRRITNAEMLKVVTMVYGGLLNKTIVSGLQARGCNALGLTGADANTILAHKRRGTEIEFGFVGDIDRVNAEPLVHFLNQGLAPVFAALTHDGAGNMLNTNADTIAAMLAQALCECYQTQLIFCFDKKGVLASDNDDDVISRLSHDNYQRLRRNGTISKGMLPKLENAFAAMRAGVQNVVICHATQLSSAARGEKECGTQLCLS